MKNTPVGVDANIDPKNNFMKNCYKIAKSIHQGGCGHPPLQRRYYANRPGRNYHCVAHFSRHLAKINQRW